MKKKLNQKRIEIKIQNGKLENFYTHTIEGNVNVCSNDINLKEIAIVIETLKKEQEKIMNKQKDEVNKCKYGSLTNKKFTPYQAIVLPDNASLSLVIKLLNDMHVDITRDDVKQFWRFYRQTIHTVEIELD